MRTKPAHSIHSIHRMPDLTQEPRTSHHKSPSAARRDFNRSIDRLMSRTCDTDAYGPNNSKCSSMSLSNVVCANNSDMICKQTMTDESNCRKPTSDKHYDRPVVHNKININDSSRERHTPCCKSVIKKQSMIVTTSDVNTEAKDVKKHMNDTEMPKHKCNEQDPPEDEFSRNIKNTSRNTDFKKFIPEIRDNEKHIVAMTNDLIFDLNMDTNKIHIVNPRHSDFMILLELIHEREDFTSHVRDNEMRKFKKALHNFRDENFKL